MQRIMIVDDDHIHHFVYEEMIADTQVAQEVLTFAQASKALDFLGDACHDADQLPDLILLDLNMPHISGWDFLEAYQKIRPDFAKDVVLMILSSSVYQKDIDRAHAYEDVADFVMTPLTEDKLRTIRDQFFATS
ncbi:response regulator [Catalinimonas alkaloidigena]|uniref:response regulator n=1 Tax=Catalinimonas alkaloidigena TaxID=1075417 RepID=UPI0015A01B9C|nr:response regulator [Catalinimonas alkaloidigena]